MSRLRYYFLTGLIVAGPLGITIYLTWSIITWVDDLVKPVLPAAYNPDVYFDTAIPGFGLLVALAGLTLLGFLTANFVGRSLLGLGEYALGRMPLVRNLYSALKQIFSTVLTERGASFQKAGLIEFPRPGVWAVVFISTPATGEIAGRLGEEDEYVSVFLPPAPNPTSGFVLYVRRSEIIELDMTVEEAAKLVISAGMVVPPPRPPREIDVVPAVEPDRNAAE
jgi:uncharacterized membrane protein